MNCRNNGWIMPFGLPFCLMMSTLFPQFHFREPPCIWRKLANAPLLSNGWRRYCASQLFRRHVSPGMKLSQLAQLLDQPAWLKQAKVRTLPENMPLDGAGIVNLFCSEQRPPARVTAEDTVLILSVFSAFAARGDLIYLSVSGKHDANRDRKSVV